MERNPLSRGLQFQLQILAAPGENDVIPLCLTTPVAGTHAICDFPDWQEQTAAVAVSPNSTDPDYLLALARAAFIFFFSCSVANASQLSRSSPSSSELKNLTS